MASQKFAKALATFTNELSIETVDKLFVFLGTKVDLDADWTGYFTEFKETLKAAAVAPKAATKAAAKADKAAAKAEKDAKPKRAPTAYNTFIGEQMAILKAADPAMNAKDRMKAASAKWKETNPAKEKVAKVAK